MLAAEQVWPGTLFVLAVLGLASLSLLVLVGSLRASGPPSPTVEVLAGQLDAGVFALSVLLAALCFVRWRLVGEAAVLWLGTGAATYGVVAFVVWAVVSLGSPTQLTGLLWLEPSARVVLVVLVLRALVAPEVDAGLRPRHALVVAATSLAVVTLLVQAVPAAASLVLTPADALAAGGAQVAGGAGLFACVWGVLAVWSLWIGVRDRRHLLAWTGLLCVGLATAHALWLVASQTGGSWPAGPWLLRFVAIASMTLGMTVVLARDYACQASALLRSVDAERRVAARVEADMAAQAERAHEATNALAAIEAATTTLQRHQDQLEPDQRAELAAAVTGEVHRLQQLIGATATVPAPGRFRLTEALAAVVTTARSQGATIWLDVPEHLVAVGQPADTSQVLHNLLQNAMRYAGGEIVIRAALEGEQVIVRVEDDGPGIPPEERELILSRGGRGSSAGAHPGSGLGLYISVRLMRRQDGELEVADSPSGGACFVLRLPGFSELAADTPGEQVDEGAQQVRELVGTGSPVVCLPRHRQQRAGVVEHDDDVGSDLALTAVGHHREVELLARDRAGKGRLFGCDDGLQPVRSQGEGQDVTEESWDDPDGDARRCTAVGAGHGTIVAAEVRQGIVCLDEPEVHGEQGRP